MSRTSSPATAATLSSVRCGPGLRATGKIIGTKFAILLTITGDVVACFQMLEDSFDVSKAAHT
jgi:hypothetical protein